MQLLSMPVPIEMGEQEFQLELALSLLFIAGCDWTILWDRIKTLVQLQEPLAERTIDHLYSDFEQGRLAILSGVQLGEICAWLRQHFPRSTGLMQHGPAAVAEVFRGQLFSYLQKSGTPEALYALQHMAGAEPADVGLKWMLAEAQKASLQKTWTPPEPAAILEMARCRDLRLVDSGEQLLEVIVESLGRLQPKLHGHSPRIEFLWDKRVDTNKVVQWQPKDEEFLSNFVRIHLEDDLRDRAIILNREVEIRRSLGKEIREGQETDVQVDAIARDPQSGEPHRISVIIEVKGCWNKKLKTAMKEQLVDRYLAESNCRHGLYLVGWFLCDAWDKGDYRKSDTPAWSLEEARKYFQEQAAELSLGGFLIHPFVLDTMLR